MNKLKQKLWQKVHTKIRLLKGLTKVQRLIYLAYKLFSSSTVDMFDSVDLTFFTINFNVHIL